MKPTAPNADHEQIAQAIAEVFGAPVQHVVVSAQDIGTPKRHVIVTIAYRWWWAFHFKRHHEAMVQAVQQIVGPNARVEVRS